MKVCPAITPAASSTTGAAVARTRRARRIMHVSFADKATCGWIITTLHLVPLPLTMLPLPTTATRRRTPVAFRMRTRPHTSNARHCDLRSKTLRFSHAGEQAPREELQRLPAILALTSATGLTIPHPTSLVRPLTAVVRRFCLVTPLFAEPKSPQSTR